MARSQPQRYYYRRPRQFRSNQKLELVVTVAVVVLVIVALIVFLAIYHDLPFRLSGAY